MSVTLLLIAHDSIAQSLLETVTNMLGNCPIPTEIFSVTTKCEPEKCLEKVSQLCKQIEKNSETLILTDLYGSTAGNISLRLVEDNTKNSAEENTSRSVVTGLSLPMLIRVMNYPNLPLSELSLKAESGAKDGILVFKQGLSI